MNWRDFLLLATRLAAGTSEAEAILAGRWFASLTDIRMQAADSPAIAL